jgi:hypothetical protein
MMKSDHTLLEAGLLGYRAKIGEIETAMVEICGQLSHSSGATGVEVTHTHAGSPVCRHGEFLGNGPNN